MTKAKLESLTKAELVQRLLKAERILYRIANTQGSHEGHQRDAETFIYGKPDGGSR